MFWLASHAVKTTVETGPDLAKSLDSKVSGFDHPHVSEKMLDLKVSTLESGFKSFQIHRSDSPDACGRKAYPERKVYGFKSIWIHVDRAFKVESNNERGPVVKQFGS